MSSTKSTTTKEQEQRPLPRSRKVLQLLVAESAALKIPVKMTKEEIYMMTPKENRKWVHAMLKEAIKKGPNTVITAFGDDEKESTAKK